MSGPNQKRVLKVLQAATHPMSVSEAAQAAGMAEKSAREAIRALHADDKVLPATNRRRGQVWMADPHADVPDDLRGRVTASLNNLRRGRGWIFDF